MAATDERELTVEIICTKLPGTDWDGVGPVHLGIQRDEAIEQATPADSKRVVFRPVLRVRRNTDGSANFLGPYAHGPRAERFIYLNWVVVRGGVPVQRPGRIKLHLNHIDWTHAERAAANDMPIRVTLELTGAKGKPVFASVRPGAARWEFPD
ncbi:MAG TPA: DUF5990 family protein [Gammaproteobacteria bacterium]|nr:DUF5990 family protein [Gammaproteobacteria bacterium]